jgi:hypothetical protein
MRLGKKFLGHTLTPVDACAEDVEEECSWGRVKGHGDA